MGRPLKYTAESLYTKLEEYFRECDEDKLMPNKAGVCVFLGISRETYSVYRDKYSDVLKVFEPRIEQAWVQRLAGNSPTGAIFYLKNAFSADFRDKIETDVTSNGKTIEGFNYIVPEQTKTHNEQTTS